MKVQEWVKTLHYQIIINVLTLFVQGVEESKLGGQALKANGFKFDVAFTSVLKRANRTLDIILKEIGQEDLPVVRHWRLNERHYGSLTGLNKVETAAKHGDEQVRFDTSTFVCARSVSPRLTLPQQYYYCSVLFVLRILFSPKLPQRNIEYD